MSFAETVRHGQELATSGSPRYSCLITGNRTVRLGVTLLIVFALLPCGFWASSMAIHKRSGLYGACECRPASPASRTTGVGPQGKIAG